VGARKVLHMPTAWEKNRDGRNETLAVSCRKHILQLETNENREFNGLNVNEIIVICVCEWTQCVQIKKTGLYRH